MKKYFSLGTLIVLVVMVTGCGKKNPTANMTSREHFEYAMKFYAKKDYTKAQDEFSVITYKYSGSDIADDAQYYLAESYFKQKDYVSAASEYERMISSYSRSEFVEPSMMQVVICYDKLSPPFALDQKYTFEALNAVQNFIDLYPTSSRRAEVEKIEVAIKDKLARKHYESAQIYRKISEYEAAIAYFDQVMADYYDSRYARQSRFWKGYCYFQLKEYQKATLILNKFIADFPAETELVKDSEDLLKKIKEQEEKQRLRDEKARRNSTVTAGQS